MKHAAVLYTCIGLMGAAAVTGFIDYSEANKSGMLARLYQEETQATGSTFLPGKEITLDDYSRGPLEQYAPPEVLVEKTTVPGKKKRSKKLAPPPPPPPPPAPKMVSENITVPVSPKPETPVAPTETIPVVDAPLVVVEAPPVVEERTAIGYESFSRAPLKRKKTTRVKKIKE